MSYNGRPLSMKKISNHEIPAIDTRRFSGEQFDRFQFYFILSSRHFLVSYLLYLYLPTSGDYFDMIIIFMLFNFNF